MTDAKRGAEEVAAEIKERWSDVIKYEALFIEIEEALTQYADAQGYEKDAWWSTECIRFRNEALEEAAKVAEVSADYYSKNMKREDGTFNMTVGSAAQTSWDIAKAIRALKSGGKAT